jgi:hypothetical protein
VLYKYSINEQIEFGKWYPGNQRRVLRESQ